MAWLAVALLRCAVAGYQYFTEGWLSSVWMLVITLIAFVMYRVRRHQRISFETVDKEISE